MNRRVGIVYLVGAGPGDPGLITVRGRELLRCADVVVYDRLSSPELLAFARRDAELVDVGKARGKQQATQMEINEVLVSGARRGQTVVRLKGGDPFVFGRGFEEWQACRAAGVPCVVVPGVSSAIAGPGAVGIPVTARGFSKSFAVITAEGAGGINPEHDFEALSKIDTLIILMGRAALPSVVQSLIDAGRSPETSTACIEQATTASQKSVFATLITLVAAVEREGLQAPMVTVIGNVAGLAQEELSNERLPLLSKRVLITRARSSSRELERTLTARGARVISCPLIRIDYAKRESNENVIAKLGKYDWIVFTSQHAVRGFFKRLRTCGGDARALAECRLAVIGKATARALSRYELKADFQPATAGADALVSELKRIDPEIGSRRILFPCGDIARKTVPNELRECGASVDELIVYSTAAIVPSPAVRNLIADGLDAMIFCSSSAVRQFVALRLPHSEAIVACIGPTTAAAARELGLEVGVVADTASAEGLVDSLERLFAEAEAGAAP